MVLVFTSTTTVLYMYQYYVYQFLSLYSRVYIRMRVGYMSITILVQCSTLERVQNAPESDSNEQ